jgi:hypothetical protein
MAISLGYLTIDHRASPGVPADIAIASGFKPEDLAEGTMVERDTMQCKHCGIPVMKNPYRTRERTFCQKCSGGYVCDWCSIAMTEPNYVHVSYKKLGDIMMNLGEKGIILGSPLDLITQPNLLNRTS